MALNMILTGDVNMMNVIDAAVPFRRVGEELRKADVVFGNLECCLTLPHPVIRSATRPGRRSDRRRRGGAGGIQAVGIASLALHYGDANIAASIARLRCAPHPACQGGQLDLAAARAPGDPGVTRRSALRLLRRSSGLLADQSRRRMRTRPASR
jgi:poly-gamma-glutamate synthesis protein (capsule biosynthesis protein)